MKATILALSFIAAIAFVATSALAADCHSQGAAPAAAQPGAKKYTCPMHPEGISDKPGKCPKCGMNLVAVKEPAAPKK